MQAKNAVREVFNNNAEEYQARFMNIDMYHPSLSLFAAQIPHDNARILDIACGPGNITQYLLQQRPIFSILGIDIAPRMLALAAANNPTAEFREMDCGDIRSLPGSFSGIVCGFCLPYLAHNAVVKLISDTHSMLHPGGSFYLSTMVENAHNQSGLRRSSSGLYELFLHYYPEGILTDLITHQGFTIIHTGHETYTAADGTITTDLMIVAVK